MNRRPLLWLIVLLGAGTALASDPPRPSPPAPPRQAPPPAPSAELSAEDREVVEHLEVLENLETVRDLDLALELEAGKETDPPASDESTDEP